jgi:hypothetical protein
MQKFTFNFWKKLTRLSLVLVCLLTSTAYAQQAITVTGTVLAKDDAVPIPGISVTVKKTTGGTATDPNGKFSIKTTVGATLVFSSIGYETQEVTVKYNQVTIILDVKKSNLNEVVVIGYGTTTRQNITTAVSKIDPKNIPSAANPAHNQAVVSVCPSVAVAHRYL